MTYSEELNKTVKEKLAKAAYKELQHIKYLTKPYYRKSRKYVSFLRYNHCLDCLDTLNFKLKQ